MYFKSRFIYITLSHFIDFLQSNYFLFNNNKERKNCEMILNLLLLKAISSERRKERESNEGKINLKFSDTNWNDRQPLSMLGSKSFSLTRQNYSINKFNQYRQLSKKNNRRSKQKWKKKKNFFIKYILSCRELSCARLYFLHSFKEGKKFVAKNKLFELY